MNADSTPRNSALKRAGAAVYLQRKLPAVPRATSALLSETETALPPDVVDLIHDEKGEQVAMNVAAAAWRIVEPVGTTDLAFSQLDKPLHTSPMIQHTTAVH